MNHTDFSPTRQTQKLLLGDDSKQTLITVNRRLSRELHSQYRLVKTAQGDQAWETPDIIPYDSWLARFWKLLTPENHNQQQLVLLNEHQRHTLWSHIIEKGIPKSDPDSAPLWNVRQATENAIAAWKLCCEWDIDIAECEQSWLEDHRRFAGWAREYMRECKDSHWQDPATLADDLITRLARGYDQPPSLKLVGFDIFTTQQTRLFDALRQAGIKTELVNLQKDKTAKPEYRRYSDANNQWISAATWAVQFLQDNLPKNPHARVGIVVPDLHAARQSVENAFTQILSAGTIFAAENSEKGDKKSGEEGGGFHISLGKPLAQYPVVDMALKVLSMCAAPRISSTVFGAIIVSPFLDGAHIERAQRQVLAAKCRADLPHSIAVKKLATTLEYMRVYKHTPLLKSIIDSLQAVFDLRAEKNSFSHWADFIAQWLKRFGLTKNADLDSGEYQAMEAFKTALTQLRSLDLVRPPGSLKNAVSEFRHLITNQLFQPEAGECAVEILGMYESSSLHFDAIWLGNMNLDSCPAKINRNPFIPIDAQLENAIPGADYQRNNELAARQFERLKNQCEHMIISRPLRDGEVELHHSALFLETEKESIADESLIKLLQKTTPQMDTYMQRYYDHTGQPFAQPKITGGSSLITNQSACAFRGYARHRLGARYQDSREPGLDAGDRGTLVHQIIEAIWQEISTSDALKKMPPAQRKTLIKTAIKNATRKHISRSGMGNGFFAGLESWLENLLTSWLQLEAARQSEFTVIVQEKEVTLTLEELELTFRIDRVDRLENGKLILMDYKTSAPISLSKWIGHAPEYRSEYPQLGLYALALAQSSDEEFQGEIEALLIAGLKLGDSQFSGFTVDESFINSNQDFYNPPTLAKSRNIDENFKKWQILRDHWQQNFSARMREFKRGDAALNPLAGACDYCDLHILCRIDEHKLSRQKSPEILETTDAS